ncbi:MAG: glycoside hydrolase family 3 N-terminal domain-containing protein [Synechococcus sp.]
MSSPTAEGLRRQVAELLVVRASGHPHDNQRRYPRWELSNNELQTLLADGVGGVILLGGSSSELRERTQTLQRWSGQALLLCADVEEGVGQRFDGASWLVPPLALARLYQQTPEAAVALAEAYGRCTGAQARRCGLNWVLGPVCDVNNNPSNPVINVRAWGEDPTTAAQLTAAVQRGLDSAGVLGCAKHFPGHGDTALDSHLSLPVLPHQRARLDAMELPPFKATIAAGVASVMTGHLLLPELDAEHPATLSHAVLTTLLRDELGFDGLVVTDALVMEAITDQYGAAEAAVLAFAAGADLILMPADASAAIDGLCHAFSTGRLPLCRLEQSLQRRRRALEHIGTSDRADDARAPGLEIVAPDEQQLEQELVARSIQITPGPTISTCMGLNLVRVDSVLPSCHPLGGTAPALALPAAQGFHTCLIHGQGVSPWQADPDAPLALDRLGEGPVLLQLFLRGNPFRGSKDSREPWPAAIRQLLELQRLAGLVVYGSPYLWDSLNPLLPDTVPAAYSPGQMPEAQRQVLSQLLPGAGSQAGAFTD